MTNKPRKTPDHNKRVHLMQVLAVLLGGCGLGIELTLSHFGPGLIVAVLSALVVLWLAWHEA